MCKFCKNIVTGNDFEAIIEGDINGDIDGYYNVYLAQAPHRRRPTLQVDVTLLNTPIVMDAIPVHYCPMCGINLLELKEDINEER